METVVSILPQGSRPIDSARLVRCALHAADLVTEDRDHALT
ncbi:hypothetical protein [Caballeronia sp. KNU42]